MKTKWPNIFGLPACAIAVTLIGAHNLKFKPSHELLNVSYAPTAGLYQALNQQFIREYAKKNDGGLTAKVSNGGSSRQAKSVIEGLGADVVTLVLPSDVDSLRKHGLVPDGWAQRLPDNSQPCKPLAMGFRAERGPTAKIERERIQPATELAGRMVWSRRNEKPLRSFLFFQPGFRIRQFFKIFVPVFIEYLFL